MDDDRTGAHDATGGETGSEAGWTQPTYSAPDAPTSSPTSTPTSESIPPANPTPAGPFFYPPLYAPPGYLPPGGFGYQPPPTVATSRRRRVGPGAVGGAVLVAALAVTGTVAVVAHADRSVTGSGSMGASSTGDRRRADGFGGLFGSGSGSGSTGSTGGGATAPGTGTSTGTATAAQEQGVVDIDTVLKYQDAEAAGTGMILTSHGEILTNNHVVDGATSITVTVVSTGRTYTADVVGTDATDDIAVLQLVGASGLTTANLGDSATVAQGDSVTGVGNAGGVGGTPSAAAGTITATDQQITATDDNGGNAETLAGLFETDADIQAGDSGGPLYNSAGKVIGIDTAASASSSDANGAGSGAGSAATTGYAIPIDTALAIGKRIEAGDASSTIVIGVPAFLGVSLADTADGAVVESVVSGSAADQAGIVAGDVITAVGSASVSSAEALHTMLGNDSPGTRVKITWTDRSGASHSATVTLQTGPAA